MYKQITTMMTVALLFAATLLSAQAPESFNYQAVIRDGSGAILANQSVSMRFTIFTGSSTGTSQYQETAALNTNAYGLVSHTVGTGTVVSGTMAGVTWDDDKKYLRVAVDLGSGYVDLGAEQLVSVPYALNAKTADALSGGNLWNANVAGTNIYNTNSSHVGIGTTVPNSKLHINATSGDPFRVQVNGNSKFFVDSTGGTAIGAFINSPPPPNGLYVAGDVGIGISAPLAPLHVAANSGANTLLGNSGGSLAYVTVNMPTGASGAGLFRVRENGNTQFVVNNASATYKVIVFGDAQASGGTWTNSDAKLKREITSLNNVLPDLMKLNPTSYYFNNQKEEFKYLNLPEEKQFGLLAQEVKQVFPNIVRESVQYGEDGEPRAQAVHSMNYTGLVPIAIKAIQEQQEQIEALKKEIDLLKSSK